MLPPLELRGKNSDQITAFRPGDAGGEVSWVRTVDNLKGAAAVESVRTAAKGDGLYTRHEYRLEHDWEHVLVTSTYRNESLGVRTIKPRAVWRGFEDSKEWSIDGIQIGDGTDPFDKRAYTWGIPPGGAPLEPEVQLQPGQEKVYQVVLAVADSPFAAYGVVATLPGKAGEVSGSAIDTSGAPAIHASLLVQIRGQALPHYPDASGKFLFRLPAGQYAVAFDDIGRERIERTVTVDAGGKSQLKLPVSPPSAVRVEIRDEAGSYSPGKVQFIGVDGTETPNFGTGYRVHGGDHQYQTHDGRFTQQVPRGRYLLRITHGPEYGLVERCPVRSRTGSPVSLTRRSLPCR